MPVPPRGAGGYVGEPEQWGSVEVGGWVLSPAVGMRGRDIGVVVRVPMEGLVASELTPPSWEGALAPDKQVYVARYRERLRAGERAPNASIVEREGGDLRVVDGHRRLVAAREEGVTALRAIVWPTVDADDGACDAAGTPIRTGLTLESLRRRGVTLLQTSRALRPVSREPMGSEQSPRLGLDLMPHGRLWSHVLDGCQLDGSFDADRGEVLLQRVRVDPALRRQGRARAALRVLTAEADRVGLSLCVCPSPLERGMSAERLRGLYVAEGFVEAGHPFNALGERRMHRPPQDRAEANDVPLVWADPVRMAL